MNPKIIIIIPVHGQVDLLKECLQSIYNTPAKYAFDILLVDDLTPGGLDEVTALFPDLQLLTNETRGYFTRTVNEGLKHVSQQGYDLYVLINSDMVVCEGWLDALVGRWEVQQQAGLVGGMELSMDDHDLIVCGGSNPVSVNGELTPINLLDRQGKISNGDLQKAELVEWVSFGIVMISDDCLKSVGYLDPDFKNYFSDADFCKRAQMSGFDIWYEPDCRVYHKRHASTRLYRTRGILLFQADREQYCTKWVPESLPAKKDDRHVNKRLQITDHHRWEPRLIPHVSSDSPFDQKIKALLLKDPDLAERVDQLADVTSGGVDAVQDWILPFKELYLKGLAYMDISSMNYKRREKGSVFQDLTLEVLSPHADDAALSVGGLLLDRMDTVNHTRVHVLFGQSGYALDHYDSLDTKEVTQLRKVEEISYCAMVGAESVFHNFPDRLLRHGDKSIYIDDPADLEADAIAHVLTTVNDIVGQSGQVIMAPLGAGLMADHAAVAWAICWLVRQGFPKEAIVLYEDLPYAVRPGAINKGIQLFKENGFELKSHTFDISQWFERKCELLAIYNSQMSEEFLSAVEVHGQAVANMDPAIGKESWRRAERLWTIV